MSTFATLRALQLVIADALDDIHRVFSQYNLPDIPSSPPSQCPSPVYSSSPDPYPASSHFPATPPASFPPTPLSATFPSSLRPQYPDLGPPFVDYPSPDLPLVSDSPGEQLALHPDAAAAASRIVAACGQMSNIVNKPFSSLCDAIMSYNLPACMRLVEHLHVVEILREAEENRHRGLTSVVPLPDVKGGPGLGANGLSSVAQTSDALTVDVRPPAAGVESRVHKGTEGLHVSDIANVICSYAGTNYIDSSDLVHALRLLSTHHIFRETAPDTFALTRIASLVDSGQSVKAVFSNPEIKYGDTGGTPAFVALLTDELFKSAAYLTEAFTGVQLPAPASAPNPSCPTDPSSLGTTPIPSASSFVTNGSVPCAPTTRSSSVLTHIVYPEDEDSSSTPSTGKLENDTLCPAANDVTVSSQLPTTKPLVPRLRPAGALKQVEELPQSGDAAKPDKLPAFNLALRTNAPFFEWLENGGEDPLGGTGQGACARTQTGTGSVKHDDVQLPVSSNLLGGVLQKPFRLQRFSRAMTGTTSWEAPRAILGGFDWHSLPKGSTVVDVGGGIGSTTMILARALNCPRTKKCDGVNADEHQPTSVAAPCHRSKIPSDHSPVINREPQTDAAARVDANLCFVVQDRPVVTALGIEAWRSKCPEMLENGQVMFQDQDFFEPQSPLEPPHLTSYPAVYLLRVVLHDWPDECARRILINLRVASHPETRLVIAEHVLPLACVDEDVLDHGNTGAYNANRTEDWTLNSVLANIEGAEQTLAHPPLLANMGKASATAYWMDLIMHITFNGKERTLREFCALALSAGWRVARMTRPEGTLFAYLVCEPIALPDDAQAIYNAIVLSSELSTVVAVPSDGPMPHACVEPSRHKQLPPRPVSLLPSPVLERSSSRCGTPTFGSRMLLPKDEELPSPRTRSTVAAKKWLKSKGLGVRSVMMQKAEKQREEQGTVNGTSARDNNDADGLRASPHMRVWWKKSPRNSTNNSSVTVHETNTEVSEHRTSGRGRRGTLRSSDSPSTPSPRVSPVHQKWPSIESALVLTEVSPPIPRARRPSVASITRKLSFATFGRRPSVPDITEPLPTPPHSETVMELAPPPTLRDDTGRSLKHLPSLPTLGRCEVGAAAGYPPIPRPPSLSFAGHSQTLPPPPVSKSTAPLHLGHVADPPKPSILKSRASPSTGKRGSPDAGHSADSRAIPHRQRRVTLSNSPSSASRTQGSVVPCDPSSVDANLRRIPSMPKLPRRLSIPMLRRKQSQSVIRDRENEC